MDDKTLREAYDRGRNDTLLAVMHRLDGEKLQCFNDEKWCGRSNACTTNTIIDRIATAIRNAISGGAEKGKE